VVVVGWEGGLRWTYTGYSKINVTTQFNNSFSIPTNMLQVTFQTTPGEAVFEATVIHDKTYNNLVTVVVS
jgi:hypothetical protein